MKSKTIKLNPVKQAFAIFLSLLFPFFFSACNSEVGDPTEIELSLKSQQLVEADNEFGIELFKLLDEEEDGNFTISPLSITMALAMTYNGAENETKVAMEEALKVSGFTTDEINESYKSLVEALLEADPLVTLNIAQAIWYREDLNVLDDFITVNQTYYDAEVSSLDFSSDDALDIINDWISDETNNKIQEMLKVIEPNAAMFLVNAVYFNGEWRKEFDEDETFPTDFTKEDDSVIEVDMMSKTDSAYVLYEDDFSAIELAYGRGNFNMVVFVPAEGKTCDDLLESMTAEKWSSWMDAMSKTYDLTIWLPKFKDEYEVELNDVLSAMGMEVAFEMGNADFSGITGDQSLYIDFVKHNTFIDVNEAGTEAAAATIVGMKDYCAEFNLFQIDKPFVYAITEKETGAILFIGKIMEPSYE